MSHRAGLGRPRRRPHSRRRPRLASRSSARSRRSAPITIRGLRARLPRPDLRLDRGRGDPSDHGSIAGTVLPRGYRRTARASDLDWAAADCRPTVRLDGGAAARRGLRGRPRGRSPRRGRSVVARSLTMGGAFGFPVDDGVVTFNDPAIQAAEIPGANGISTAESLARLYAACVGTPVARPLLSASSIAGCPPGPVIGARSSPACPTMAPGGGPVSSWRPRRPSRCSGPPSFGHAGAGGQLGFADADHRVGFAYLSNQMGGYGDATGSESDAGPPRRRRRLSRAQRCHVATRVDPRPQLLTYPDSLGGDLLGASPTFWTGPLDGLFRGVHILPPFPSSGDRGFAPLTYREIDPTVRDAGTTLSVLAGVTTCCST